MDINKLPDNPYLLLTPGPLSTSKSVKATMLKDWCTWDNDYNDLVQHIRQGLLNMANVTEREYSAVLMQGSGTFSVESVVGSMLPEKGKLLVIANGAYGDRIAKIAHQLKINTVVLDSGELSPPDPVQIDNLLRSDEKITHVAMVHCETTTGMLNPIKEVGAIAKAHEKIYFVDAMSSFGGIPINFTDSHIDFLVSSANKCIQGVPGFGFIIAKKQELEKMQRPGQKLIA